MNIKHSSAIRLLFTPLLLVSVGLPACTHSNTAAPPSVPAVFVSDVPPDDFAISVTVYARPGASRRAALPPEKRPARYILEPDWILRTQSGAGVGEQTYPSRTRQLTRTQVIGLWRELRQSGLTNINHSAIVGRVPDVPDALLADTSDGSYIPPVYAVSYAAGGIRRTMALQGGDEAAAVPLVRALAAAAWIVK